jgi:hypothetical protein
MLLVYLTVAPFCEQVTVKVWSWSQGLILLVVAETIPLAKVKKLLAVVKVHVRGAVAVDREVVGTLFNTCNGAQPTSLSTATAPLTCTFTTASNFLTFASGIVSATTNRINPWDQDQTFTVTCSQKGATVKYTSNIVSVSYTGCGTQTPVATSAAVAFTGTVGQQDNFYAS